MTDPREDAATDTLAEPRRLLCQIQAEIDQTGRTYHRIVHEGAEHFQTLQRKAQEHLNENTVDEYVEQGNALHTMLERHAQVAAEALPPSKD